MGTRLRRTATRAAITGAALFAIGATAGPAQAASVRLANGGIDVLVAGAGQANDVTIQAIRRTADGRAATMIEVSEAATTMTAGAGCRVSTDGRRARCQVSGRRFGRFYVRLGTLADKLRWTRFEGIVRTYFEVRGGSGDDALTLPPAGDRLYGDSGNDVLAGGAGGDRIFGGIGNDILGGDAGNDLVNGEAGNDQVVGGDGADRLNGGLGDDQLNSRDGAADIGTNCGDGSDRLFRDRSDPFTSNCEQVAPGGGFRR